MRPWLTTVVTTLLASGACSVITSHEDVASCDGAGAETFEGAVTAEELAARCWFTRGDDSQVFPNDGDLVIVGRDPGGGMPEWKGGVEGPLFHRVFESSFLLVTRVEILNRVSADLCLSQEQRVGLVVRSRDGAEPVTLFIHTNPSDLDCEAEGGAVVHASLTAGETTGSLTDLSDQGVAEDGEVDLAICRAGDILAFYVRDPTSLMTAPIWREVETSAAIRRAGVVEAGLAAAGAPDAETPFGVEAHFAWVAFEDALGGDGCARALEEDLKLPEYE
jgi:hypothetical protein